MKLSLVRHGQTVENSSNIIQGQQPGELSPLGILQAERFASHFTSLAPDSLYCSDLKRARDSLTPFLRERSDTVVYTPLIRERSFGVLEGKEGQHYLNALQQAQQSRIEFRPPGGENFEDLSERTRKFLDGIIAEHLGQHVLVLSHGGTLRAMIAHLTETSLEELLRTDLHNMSVSTFSLDSRGEVCEYSLNDISHLAGLDDGGRSSLGVDAVPPSPR
ncbi:histidine phosphatase family protein [bacterium]|nr:histidine phosphatase family protein [bacterium]